MDRPPNPGNAPDPVPERPDPSWPFVPARIRAALMAHVGVEPGDRAGAAVAFFTLFGLVMAHEQVETARDAIFLTRFSAAQLPYVYLALAGLAAVIPLLSARFGRRGRDWLVGSLALSALICVALWFIGGGNETWFPYVLYVWSTLAVAGWMVRYWLTVSQLYTVRQAKKMFALVAIGGLLGNVAGAGLAQLVASRFPPRHLLLVAAGLLVVTGVFGAARLKTGPLEAPSDAAVDPEPGAAAAVPRRYLYGIAALTVLAAIATKLVEFLYLRGASTRIAPAELAVFLARVSMVGSTLALVVQLLLAPWALRRVGVPRSLAALPTLIAAGAGWVASGSFLHAPITLRTVDVALRQPLFRTAMELLYVPLSPEVREKQKALIDIGGQRGGHALAAVFLLVAGTASRDPRWLGGAAALAAVLWVIVAVLIKHDYVALFRATVEGHSVPKSAAVRPQLDGGSLDAIKVALQSEVDTEVIGAIELVESSGNGKMLPVRLLAHPSASVILRALPILFAVSSDAHVRPAIERLLGHPDAAVRAASLRATGDQNALLAALDDPDERVRATALVVLHASGTADTALLRGRIDRIVQSGTEAEQLAVVEATAAVLDAPATALLAELADSASVAVQREIARLALRTPSAALFPLLLPMLASPQLRDEVRAAIVAIGDPALAALEAALHDPATHERVRRHLPGTLARFGPRTASALLLRFAEEPDEGIRDRIVRALGRLRARNPELELPREELVRAMDLVFDRAFRELSWRHILGRGALEDVQRQTASHTLIRVLLEDTERHALERVMRLLDLIERSEDFHAVFRAVTSNNAGARASSVELLQNTVSEPFRGPVVALCDLDAPLTERVRRGGRPTLPLDASYAACLADMASHGDATVRSLVAHHTGELPSSDSRVRGRVVGADQATLGPAERHLWTGLLPVLAGLSPAELALVAQLSEERLYPPGAAIVSAGEVPAAMHLVVEGSARRGDDSQMLAPRAVIGTETIGRGEAGAAVVAVSEVRTLSLPAKAFFDVLVEHVAISRRVVGGLAARVLASGAPMRVRMSPDEGSETWRGALEWTCEPAAAPVRAIGFLQQALGFGELRVGALAELSQRLERFEAAAGESIWKVGDASDSALLVLEGSVRWEGAAGAACSAGPGTQAGLLEALAGGERQTSVIASDPLVAFRLAADDLYEVLEDQPDLLADLLCVLASERDGPPAPAPA